MASLNNVILLGYLTKDPEITYYNKDGKQKCLAKYQLAVGKTFGQGANYIFCQAFGKNGEFVEKYLKKGMQILVTGELETGSYKNDSGKTIYTWAVNVSKHTFVGNKGDNVADTTTEEKPKVDDDGFTSIPETIDNADGDTPDLPFDFNY